MKRRSVNAEVITARNEAWRKLTPAEQLKALDMRLGKGKGAKRQRARLEAK